MVLILETLRLKSMRMSRPPGRYGCDPGSFPKCYGLEGRPDPLAETHLYSNLGIGQRMNIGEHFQYQI